MKRMIPLAAMLLAVPVAWAQGHAGHNLYFGGGFGSAEVPQAEETQAALQLIVGLPLTPLPQAGALPYGYSLEAGYVDVSDYPYDRYWGSAVVRRYLNSDIDLLLRLGTEAGNNEGFLTPLGALGVEYKSDAPFRVRLEVIERADSPMTMINFIYQP